MNMLSNHFLNREAAQRYHQFRPLIHDSIAERIASFCFSNSPIDKALDVACGTGHSTLPLLKIAKEVTGIDSSESMLEQAQNTDHVSFIHASAEALPFPNQQFDLITVGLAYHWFDQSAFLNEAVRVLKPSGWLVIYNNWMTGKMADEESFTSWINQHYLQRYPNPARGKSIIEEHEQLTQQGDESFEKGIEMSLEELLGYLTTQSNITSVLSEKLESLESVESWLTSKLSTFYRTRSKQRVMLGVKIGFYQTGEA